MCLPTLRGYQRPVLMSTAKDDVTISAPQLGKTFTGATWLASAAWMGGKSIEPWWWIAPTYSTCRHGFRLMCDLMQSAGVLESQTTTPPLQAKLINGALIEGRSWDRPEGLYGPTIRGAVVDEFGQLTAWAYSAISSRRAETVSRGEGHIRYLGNVGEIGGEAERLWNMAESGEPGFASRRWSWRDRAWSHACGCGGAGGVEPDLATAHLHSSACRRGVYLMFVKREAGRMSAPQFRQLYGAEWADWNLLPVYTFDREVHDDDSLVMQGSLPVDLMCDFNVDPMAWLVGQHKGEDAWVLDEISLGAGATTVSACKEMMRRYPNPGLTIHVYGDASGSARKTSADETDYQIMRRMLRGYYREVQFRVPVSNPAVVNRVNSFNARLRSASGEVRWRCHPRCRGLRKDLARVSWKPGTREIKKVVGLTHFSDAEGYRMARLYPVGGGSRVIRTGSESGSYVSYQDAMLGVMF